MALDEFTDAWQSRYPMLVQDWRHHWHELKTYPAELRRMVYTTRAIQSLHSRMIKNLSSRKVFSHDDAVIRILFLKIRNFLSAGSNARDGYRDEPV